MELSAVEPLLRSEVYVADPAVDPEALPSGHPVILLPAVLAAYTAPECLLLVEKCHDALPDGGALIVCDLFAGEHTAEDCAAWMAEVGFTDVAVSPASPGLNAVVVATKG
jgi:3-hydroxy-5-methyl-1-naphthoate 3-O-methyltransferase